MEWIEIHRSGRSLADAPSCTGEARWVSQTVGAEEPQPIPPKNTGPIEPKWSVSCIFWSLPTWGSKRREESSPDESRAVEL